MEAGCRGRLSGMKGWRRCFHEQRPDHPGSLCFSFKKNTNLFLAVLGLQCCAVFL